MIRHAIESDCVDIAALALHVWLHTYATQGVRSRISNYALSTLTEQHFIDSLEQPSIDIWIYEHNEHLVGFVVVDLNAKCTEFPNAGYEIMTLYVSPHFSRQGIGRRLLESIEIRHGSPFWLSTWVNNENAISFYQHLGLTVIGERHFDLEGERHRNHIFMKASTW